MKKINLEIIKDYIKSILDKKNKKKSKSKIILNKFDNKEKKKKRKIINIRISKIKLWWFFKKNYIPYFLISSIILMLILIFILVWPLFKVKSIEVVKLDNVTNMEIVYESLRDFRWESIFSISERDIFNKLKDYQDNIKSVKLKISLPDTLKIEVWSFIELFNIYLNDKTYILVENGTLVPTNQPSRNLKDLNVVKNNEKNMFLEYRKIFDPIFITRINNTIKLLEENIIDIKLENFTYYEIERELHIETENKTLLLFSIDWFYSIEEQIKNIVIFNKEREQINKDTIRYIDLRIKNRIFYCLNKTLNTCNENIKNTYFQ